MPAGQYYIGDLCYVMHDKWETVCSMILFDNHMMDGEHVLNNNIPFACYGTRWGDGEYFDQQNNRYLVDAGLIGCIRNEDIFLYGEHNDSSLGNIITFNEPFKTGSEEGIIYFGHVEIDTN